MSLTTTPTQLSAGRRRAAIALVALGEERAANVLSALGETESTLLAAEVLALGPVSADDIGQALVELGSQLNTIHAATAPGEQFTRSMLATAFGAAAAGRIMEDITRPAQFAWLASADPDVAGRVLAAEPPSTIALALAHLDAKAGARLLTRLPESIREEVALRVASLEGVDVETVATVDAALRERVGTTLRAQVTRVDGAEVLAGMLSAAPRSAEESLIASLQGIDPELARRIRAAMFTFEDLKILPSRDLQKILSQVETGDLSLAVYAATEETREAVMSNLSERARENLEEEISYLQNVRPSASRAAAEKVMEVVRRLEAENEIELPREGDDETEVV